MEEGETRHEGCVGFKHLHGTFGVHLHTVVLTLFKSLIGLGVEV